MLCSHLGNAYSILASTESSTATWACALNTLNNLDTLEKKCCVCLHVVTIYGVDAVANEIDVVLKFFDSGMKIQDFNYNTAKCC
jgi:hypothetical protein